MSEDVRKSIRLPVELATRIDAARGFEPWSSWVKRALEQALGGSTPPVETRGSRSSTPARASDTALARQERLNRAKGL